MKAFFGNKQEVAEGAEEERQANQQQQQRWLRGRGADEGAGPRAEDLQNDAVIAQALQDTFDDEHYLFKAKQETQIDVDSRVAHLIQSSDAESARMAETFYGDVETSKRVQVIQLHRSPQ